MAVKPKSSYRLAIRAEGAMMNAYLAPANTMEGAMLLGSLLRRPLDDDAELWETWKACMRDAASVVISTVFGGDIVAEWSDETPAPEHERSGNA